jgi:hypothetical protein
MQRTTIDRLNEHVLEMESQLRTLRTKDEAAVAYAADEIVVRTRTHLDKCIRTQAPVPRHWSAYTVDDDAFMEQSSLDPLTSTYTHVTEQLRQRLQQRFSEIQVLHVCCMLLSAQWCWECLQEDVTRLRTSREQLSAQLAVARRQMDEMQMKTEQFDDVLAKYQVDPYSHTRLINPPHSQQIHAEHQALLQMYGEKVEQLDEMRMDVADLRTMLKQQVNGAHFAIPISFHPDCAVRGSGQVIG